MSKGRILVVDDDRLVLATVTHGLAQAGYEVIDADNGDEAILLAREQRPDLALLDIRMEGKSGFDVAEYLRDVSRIPFMFLSAFADEGTRAKVRELGALDYMVKPLEVAQIVPAVDAAIRRIRSGAGVPAAPAMTAGVAAAVAAPPAATSGEGPAALAPSRSAALPPDVMADVVALAVGVLMHRYSLTRGDAWTRLQRLAAEQGATVAEQASRLVGAVEELARSARF